MAMVDKMLCPLHREGTIFMWYAKMNDGKVIYEYDDRKETTSMDKFRLKYINYLEKLTQLYYRRDISFFKNIIRILLAILDTLVCIIRPEVVNGFIRENKFTSLNTNDIDTLGIMGNGGHIFINSKDGVIHLDGNRDLNVHFMLRNKRVDITNNPDLKYNDLIERHYTSYEFDLTGRNKEEVTSDGHVHALAIGHKNKILVPYEDYSHKITFDYELIYVLPLGSPNYIILNITSQDVDVDIELHLTFLANDDKQMVHLEKGKESTFTIGF